MSRTRKGTRHCGWLRTVSERREGLEGGGGGGREGGREGGERGREREGGREGERERERERGGGVGKTWL